MRRRAALSSFVGALLALAGVVWQQPTAPSATPELASPPSGATGDEDGGTERAFVAPVSHGLWVTACGIGDDPRIAPPSFARAIDLQVDELVARSRRSSSGASPSLRAGLASLDDPARAVTLFEQAPDRIDGPFDHAAAAALLAGRRALAAGNIDAATRWAARTSTLAPSDPFGPLLLAGVAMEVGDEIAARDALRLAAASNPLDPGVGWALGVLLARTEHLRLAVSSMDTYLRTAPHDVGRRRVRTRVAQQAASAHAAVRRERNGVVLFAPPELDPTIAAQVLETVDEALAEAATWTGTERAAELVVLVHQDGSTMRAVTCSPSWTGAVFDGILHTDLGSLRRGDIAVRMVLRHETLHAQLHLRRGRHSRIPRWLDEGAAQRFGRDPIDLARWELLVREQTWIPFASLDGPFAEFGEDPDVRLAYSQSLAMVMYLERRHGDHAIADAIAAVDLVPPSQLLETIAPELDGPRLLDELDAIVAEIYGGLADQGTFGPVRSGPSLDPQGDRGEAEVR